MRSVILTGLFSLIALSAWAQDTYTINLTTNAAQEDVILKLYHNACAEAIASSQTLPGGCSQVAPPLEQTCSCTPTNVQKRNFLIQRYLVTGFQADRDALHLDRGRELRRLYPTFDKATRDIIDAASGLDPLP